MERFEVKAEDVLVGDQFRRVSGYSHRCDNAVTYEVVSVTVGCHPKNPARAGVNYKLRDLRTGRCNSEFQPTGRLMSVYR